MNVWFELCPLERYFKVLTPVLQNLTVFGKSSYLMKLVKMTTYGMW